MGNQLILVVQIQHRNSSRSRGHMQSQPFTDGVGGGEGYPGLMQMPVQNPEGALDETPVLWRYLAG